ncbi:MAG TPA: hypothetical protein ENF93_00420 [Ignisphaera sp.]|nr:hypothetical protein [Ignisphaera sp.]
MGYSENLKNRCIAILDTSILMLIAEGKLSLEDIETALPHCILAVLDVVIFELQKLSSEKGLKARRAEWILSNIVPRLRLIRSGIEGNVDDALLQFATAQRCVIITSDRGLKNRAVKRGISVAFFRESKRGFELIGSELV